MTKCSFLLNWTYFWTPWPHSCSNSQIEFLIFHSWWWFELLKFSLCLLYHWKIYARIELIQIFHHQQFGILLRKGGEAARSLTKSSLFSFYSRAIDGITLIQGLKFLASVEIPAAMKNCSLFSLFFCFFFLLQRQNIKGEIAVTGQLKL